MEEIFSKHLSLEAKEQLVRTKGRFVDGQDYYSFRILFYTLGNQNVELVYDFTNAIVSVELVEKKCSPAYFIDELESRLDDE